MSQNTGAGRGVLGAAAEERPWADAFRPLTDRVEALLAAMTLNEKLAQLASVWIGAELGGGDGGGNVAPMQEAFADPAPVEEAGAHGMGHFTRPLGTSPVDAVEGARRLAGFQQELIARTRLGLPAIAHEECLTGFTTFGATVFPTPLALAATFDPAGVERMTRAIGEGMRAAGVHQGLSPVLDVVRDYRWGRVEETMGEDPYLVGVIATGYVRGLEQTGIVATLKHFAGYSASRAARNHAPVSMGPRELRDVILLPFEMAIREGGARSVMNSYSDVDGVPAGADVALLTGILRDEWGFEGVVVSDYWAIAFLETMHRIAGSPGEAGALALEAGIDVELPHVRSYAEPLAELVRAGAVPERLVDRAARRVLRQKCELGLLDADWSPESPALVEGTLDLDPPEGRAPPPGAAGRGVVAGVAGRGGGPAGPRPAGGAGARAGARRGVRRPAGERRRAAAGGRGRDRPRRPVRGRPAAVPRLLLVPEPRRVGGA